MHGIECVCLHLSHSNFKIVGCRFIRLTHFISLWHSLLLYIYLMLVRVHFAACSFWSSLKGREMLSTQTHTYTYTGTLPVGSSTKLNPYINFLNRSRKTKQANKWPTI